MSADKSDELRHEDSKVVALIRLAQERGDRDAFGELFELFRPTVLALAVSVLRNQDAAGDLVQDVFLRVIEKIDQLREPERFAGWLRRMTVNMARNVLRKNRGLTTAEGGEDLFDQVAGRDRTADEDVCGQEVRAIVLAAVDRLKPLDRDTLVAFYLEGKSLKVIAREEDVPLGTIKRRLFTARKRLSVLMGASP